MSMFVGKDGAGFPLLHFTKKEESEADLATGPLDSTIFHSSMEYLQVYRHYVPQNYVLNGRQSLVGTSSQRDHLDTGSVDNDAVTDLLGGNLGFSNRRYANVLGGYNNFPSWYTKGDEVVGDREFHIDGQAGMSFAKQSAIKVVEYSALSVGAGTGWLGQVLGNMSPYGHVHPSSGQPGNVTGSLAFECDDYARGTFYGSSASGDFVSDNLDYDQHAALFWSSGYVKDDVGTVVLRERIFVNTADRESQIPSMPYKRGGASFFGDDIWYVTHDAENNPVTVPNTLTTGVNLDLEPNALHYDRGTQESLLFLNIKRENSSPNNYVMEDTPKALGDAGEILINNEDILIGDSWSFKDRTFFLAYDKTSGTDDFFTDSDTHLANEPLFKLMNVLYPLGSTLTDHGFHRPLLDGTIDILTDSNNVIKGWRTSNKLIPAFTPDVDVPGGGIQLTNNSLSWGSGSSLVPIVTPDNGFLKLTAEPVVVSAPGRTFDFQWIKDNYTDLDIYPFDTAPSDNSTQDDVHVYTVTTQIGSFPMPPGTEGANEFKFILENHLPSSPATVTRDGKTTQLSLNYERRGTYAPIYTVARKSASAENNDGHKRVIITNSIMEVVLSCSDIYAWDRGDPKLHSGNQAQAVSLRYSLEFDFETNELLLIQTIYGNSGNYVWYVNQADGTYWYGVYAMDDDEVVYTIPDYRLSVYMLHSYENYKGEGLWPS